METQPRFIKEFSKQNSPEERKRLAQEIREKREALSYAKRERERKMSEADLVLKEIESLRSKIEAYNDDSFFGKIKDFFQYKKLKRELDETSGIHRTFEEELNQTSSGQPGLEEIRKMLSAFYDSEEKKWEELPFSKEDIQRNFTEENLSALPIDDYAVLLKRFPSNMVTHVTRQGIRDHYSLDNHIAGVEEYHNNFKSILKKKRLNSALGIDLQESSKEKVISNYLDQYVVQLEAEGYEASKSGALLRVDSKLGYGSIKGSPYNFADRSAIHVATEEVADDIYGGERGNEIFFTFPSIFVASQMEFGGQLSKPAGGSHNDQRIWANLEEGMSIDAGIVFVPEDARVDPESGSKYELDENNKPIILEENIKGLKMFADSVDPEFVSQAMEVVERYRIYRAAIENGRDINEESEVSRAEQAINELRNDLEMKFGIKEKFLQEVILDGNSLRKIRSALYEWPEEYRKKAINKAVREALMNKEALFAKAQNPVSSKEYWEMYFSKHPQERPSKLVYYAGGNPTKALYDWRKEKGIIKRSKESDMGFSENSKMDDEMNETPEQQRFMSIAKKIIDERFNEALL